jgi:hypothetical protein
MIFILFTTTHVIFTLGKKNLLRSYIIIAKLTLYTI